MLSERMKRREAERQELKAQLERDNQITAGCKADLLFEIAWDRGHSAGLAEVAMEYAEMAPLFKD